MPLLRQCPRHTAAAAAATRDITHRGGSGLQSNLVGLWGGERTHTSPPPLSFGFPAVHSFSEPPTASPKQLPQAPSTFLWSKYVRRQVLFRIVATVLDFQAISHTSRGYESTSFLGYSPSHIYEPGCQKHPIASVPSATPRSQRKKGALVTSMKGFNAATYRPNSTFEHEEFGIDRHIATFLIDAEANKETAGLREKNSRFTYSPSPGVVWVGRHTTRDLPTGHSVPSRSS
ncbi:hypothetical protein BDK51DRAFT_46995 [Blyttiomyces helicus]|uniref:Uncharacterized protein n=1 Tax=Blyttiomyces helicus TaxID=388810 RepID=A0A4V1IQF8_9FUNG|nr:hypothetical protein BDK51DRAFT_46995 [Blyttiomyces helicus]|eukprot:RKO86407.1 hypothetical protein BDK51DRAFT_46995 [Blyttiomyces helicus]